MASHKCSRRSLQSSLLFMLFVSRERRNVVLLARGLVSKAMGSSVSLDHPLGLAFASGLARPLLDSRSTLNSGFSYIWKAVVLGSDSEVTQPDFSPASAAIYSL